MNAVSMLTLTLLLLTACSREPHWVSIPNGKAGEVIDLSSIAASGNVRTASIRIILTTRASWDTAPEATIVENNANSGNNVRFSRRKADLHRWPHRVVS